MNDEDSSRLHPSAGQNEWSVHLQSKGLADSYFRLSEGSTGKLQMVLYSGDWIFVALEETPLDMVLCKD